MECLKKFSTDCSEGQTSQFYPVRLQLLSVVGNNCPNLTLGLFCPGEYSSLINNFSCTYDQAVDCLPDPGALGGLKRGMLEYCRSGYHLCVLSLIHI